MQVSATHVEQRYFAPERCDSSSRGRPARSAKLVAGFRCLIQTCRPQAEIQVAAEKHKRRAVLVAPMQNGREIWSSGSQGIRRSLHIRWRTCLRASDIPRSRSSAACGSGIGAIAPMTFRACPDAGDRRSSPSTSSSDTNRRGTHTSTSSSFISSRQRIHKELVFEEYVGVRKRRWCSSLLLA